MPSAWAGCLLEIWEETRQQTPRGLARPDGEAGERVSAGSCGDMLGWGRVPRAEVSAMQMDMLHQPHPRLGMELSF